MSGYSMKYEASCMNLPFIQDKIEESLANGVDDDEISVNYPASLWAWLPIQPTAHLSRSYIRAIGYPRSSYG